MPASNSKSKNKELGRLTNEFARKVVNAANVVWTTTGQVPTIDSVCAVLYPHGTSNKTHVAKVMASDVYRDTCDVRGIPVGAMPGLTAAQVYCAQIMTNPADKRDFGRKLKSAGVTHIQYRNWLKQPAFSAYMQQIGEDLLNNHVQDVNAMLVNKATGGDTAAMRMYYEINGKLGLNREQNTDLYKVINGLIEIITRRLAGTPELLQAISSDIDVLIQGGTVNTDLPILEGTVVDSVEKEELDSDG